MAHKIYEHIGIQYHCGLRPRLHGGLLQAYRAVAATYNRQQIQQAIAAGKGSLQDFVWVILNQGQYGDCWDYSELNALMTKLNMLYGEKVLLDASMAVVLTGQYDGGGIDSAIAQVFSVTGVATAEFMGTDPTRAITKRRKSLWPQGWQQNAALRKIPDGDWADTDDSLELASAIVDGNPSIVGVSWQGGGHALECAEVRTSKVVNQEIESFAARQSAKLAERDEILRQRDKLSKPAAYHDEETGKLRTAGPCVTDLASDSELVFAGPNSWGTDWNSGWGSYPGRAGWWMLSEQSAAMEPTFSSGGFGCCVLHGATDLDLPTIAGPRKQEVMR